MRNRVLYMYVNNNNRVNVLDCLASILYEDEVLKFVEKVELFIN